MATNITRLCFLSSTTSSTAPFLYHTRTLTSLSSPLRNQLDRRSPRAYSTQHNASEINAETQSPEPTSQNPSEESIAPTTEPDAAPKLRRSFLKKRGASVSKRPSDSRPARPDIKPTKTAPKITSQEKLIFGGLLEQLGLKHDGESAKPGPSDKPLSEEKQAEMAELASVFDTLLKDPRQKKAALKAQRQLKEAHNSSRKAEKSEPEEQPPTENQGPKRIYLRDLGYSEPATSSAAEVTVSLRQAIEIVIKAEYEHIEFALFQAVEDGRGDIGVWEVCKERIFSMLRHLDEKSLEEASDPESASSADQTPTGLSGPLRVPAAVPVAPVVVGLYPKTLLVAFRLLNTHFPQSPLISQFRSTIKDYGRVSAFLGASSGLYDELIYYHWRVCKDLPTVVTILGEMNQLGIDPSSKSRGLLTGLIIRHGRDLQAHRKSEGGNDFFWDLPSNKEAFEELVREGGWMDQIEARAEEKRQRDILRNSRR